MLELKRISVAYGKHEALHEVSISAQAGRTTVILGANGAGKTTLLNTIGGLMRPRPEGRILFQGRSMDGEEVHRIVDAGISLVPQGRRLFSDLNVLENLRMGAYLPRVRGRVDELLERQFRLFPRLAERSAQRAGTMSGGEQQMLAIARALMADPTLLLLDEPSLGLSPLITKELFSTLRQITQGGQSVLMVEQNVRMSLDLADDAYVLENGRISRSGSAKELGADAGIRRAYLGL